MEDDGGWLDEWRKGRWDEGSGLVIRWGTDIKILHSAGSYV